MAALRLGVNVDHVATVRNARGGAVPDPVRAALLAIEAGADGITAHLREDRRHIHDDDMRRLKASIAKPLNFEMAATEAMLDIALAHPPARLLPGAGKAHRAHHRRRPRRGRRLQRAEALRRRTRRAPGFACRCSSSRRARRSKASAASRRAGRRTAHRRLVRRAGARRSGQRRLRIRPPAGRGGAEPRRSGSNATPATASTTTPRASIAGLAADRRAQHRPFPRRRGDLRRPRRGGEGHARGDGGGAGDGGAAAVIVGIGSDLCDIRAIEETLARFGERFVARCFTEIEQRKSDAAGRRAPPPTPSASPPRRPAPRRSAPGLRRGRVLARHGGRQPARPASRRCA